MKRRDFMKAVAATPLAGKAGIERSEAFAMEPSLHSEGHLQISVPLSTRYDISQALYTFWGESSIGRKMELVVHKNGLDVRFVE